MEAKGVCKGRCPVSPRGRAECLLAVRGLGARGRAPAAAGTWMWQSVRVRGYDREHLS